MPFFWCAPARLSHAAATATTQRKRSRKRLSGTDLPLPTSSLWTAEGWSFRVRHDGRRSAPSRRLNNAIGIFAQSPHARALRFSICARPPILFGVIKGEEPVRIRHSARRRPLNASTKSLSVDIARPAKVQRDAPVDRPNRARRTRFAAGNPISLPSFPVTPRHRRRERGIGTNAGEKVRPKPFAAAERPRWHVNLTPTSLLDRSGRALLR